jgi:hypothetical protein
MPLAAQYNPVPARVITTTQTVAGTTTTASFAVDLYWRIDFGATGAVQTTSRIARGMTVTRSGAGVYAITGLPQGAFAVHFMNRLQALLPEKSWAVTTYSATAGTATFTHTVGGAATDPTSGDALFVQTHVEDR